jgi:NADPH:quinone reductase-like Zn-dependent oxidoreductase
VRYKPGSRPSSTEPPGVGTFAVQIAAALGAEVTGVCGPANAELVRSATHVIDYTARDFTSAGECYDVILDNVGNQPLSRLRRVLSPGATSPSTPEVHRAMCSGRWDVCACGRRQRVRATADQPVPTNQNRDDLLALTGLIEDGKLMPVLGRVYPLADTAEGLRHVEQGHARRKVIIAVSPAP